MTALPELESYIAGEWRRGPVDTADINPAQPGTHVARVHLADTALAVSAIDAAASAAHEWRTADPVARGDILRAAGDLLDARADDIARDLSREEGKTFAESKREVQLAARVMRYYAVQALDPSGDTYPARQPGNLVYTQRVPVGVVTAITPWNFPMSLPAWKLAAALAFGNVVVWKPAEIVPLTAVHLASALVDAGLPAGVLNLLLGKGSEVGEVIVRHPAVDAVTFTGSNEIGRGVQSVATREGKRVQLELGGKNPAIVLADADLDLAAEQISIGAFGASGQKCTATSRVVVERAVVDPLVERIQALADGWQLGDPLDPSTTMGPLASARQLETVVGLLDIADREGARVVAGGARPNGDLRDGYFVRPTVLVDVKPGATIAREEVFGPVVAVLPVDSFDEAIEVANDTRYGLSASVFTNDLTKALRFSEASRTGMVRVNTGTSGMEFYVPFGGTKESGFGPRELGKSAREFLTETKTVYLSHG
ncbi:MAG TPA: aldehyde dehydrogenase family protein [Jatrophihabitans sp.]|nr:aldehyde dehydrogenase family protein [Jatrophihabitans sp.]